MAANTSNKSRKSRAVIAGTPARTNTGKNAAYRTSVSSQEPIHSKERINWFTLGSWSLMLVMCLAFWAGVIALFM